MIRVHFARALAAAVLVAVAACAQPDTARDMVPASVTIPEGAAVATFAGGCFWCMEPPFDQVDGVIATVSGYTGGTKAEPTYRQVAMGNTGHAEAVEVIYDPTKVTYDQLLEVYWRNVDPLDARGQFCDRGDPYRTAIFVHDEQQRRLAERSKQALIDSMRFERPVVTEIVPAGRFYPAEVYHQDFYEKNPLRYRFYRAGCRRDARLTQLWG